MIELSARPHLRASTTPFDWVRESHEGSWCKGLFTPAVSNVPPPVLKGIAV